MIDSFVDEVPSENTLETLQHIDKFILKITESIQVLRSAKHKLSSKEKKTKDDEAELVSIQKKLDRQLRELDEKFEVANKLVTKMQEQTTKLIDIAKRQKKESCLKNHNQNSTGEFHKVVILNREKHHDAPPHIMVLESMKEFEELNQCCSSFTDINETISCSQSCCETKKKITSTIPCVSSESINYKIKAEICQLKECLRIIIKKNQDYRYKLKITTNRNEMMERSLKNPAPFKNAFKGGIRFPGKKEMEEKLSIMKSEIIKLNNEIEVVQKNQLKLKFVKDFIEKYNDLVVNCQCESPTSKNNIDTINKVKEQQIHHIDKQIKQKANELKKLICDYEGSVKTCSKVFAKQQKLSDHLANLCQKIGGREIDDDETLKKKLIKTNEEIETMELIIEERTHEIREFDEKVKEVESETNETVEKTKRLQVALTNLSEDFIATYNNLEFVYQEQMEEMMALPIILKATHIKLQQETDIRVLAEETRDKLIKDIKEAEAMNKPIQNDDKLIEQLEAENKALESVLKNVDNSFKACSMTLDEVTKELKAVNLEVEDAIVESNKRVKGFKKFTIIKMDKISNDLLMVQELLAELQGKECEKAINRKTVLDHLNAKINSLYLNMVECKSEMNTFFY